MSKILIIGGTHGHERVGVHIMEKLRALDLDASSIDFEIGNPKAFEQNIPFIENDLNRVFPGKEHGTYEEMRAFELSSKIREADLVIDIHSTNTTDLSVNSMLIVTKYDIATKQIIDIIKPPKVLYMKYKGGNALISGAKVGIAFEYGKDTSEDVLNAILHDIANVLIEFGHLKDNPYTTNKPHVAAQVFEVYDAFKKEFSGSYTLNKHIHNFETFLKDGVVCETEQGEKILASEDFIPILFGENRYTEILGFKARGVQA